MNPHNFLGINLTDQEAIRLISASLWQETKPKNVYTLGKYCEVFQQLKPDASSRQRIAKIARDHGRNETSTWWGPVEGAARYGWHFTSEIWQSAFETVTQEKRQRDAENAQFLIDSLDDC